MLDIQQVTEAINLYRRNKGFIKKLTRSEHPAITATAAYIATLRLHKKILSSEDLFTINRFFLLEHPVHPGKAAYKAWLDINYHYFCVLNHAQTLHLARLLKSPVPIKYAGFATCSQAGYQQFPEHFSKLMREQLDKKSNGEKMWEFFQVLSVAYQQNDFTEEYFPAFSKLCVEGMLNQHNIRIIQQSKQASLLAECLIKLKHTDTLTAENQLFISTYSQLFLIQVTQMLIVLDIAGLNTLTNREILASFPHPLPLRRAIAWLEKINALTQENFDVISAEANLSWLLALEEMPEALITEKTWQGLLNLSKKGEESEVRKNVKDYAELLKKQHREQIGNGILPNNKVIETQTIASTSAVANFFSVTPTMPFTPSAADEALKASIVP
ncbi:MAG: hypothetical protein RLY40_581 [Pseudomonadota bacterium]|jgi:hypothetical protein